MTARERGAPRAAGGPVRHRLRPDGLRDAGQPLSQPLFRQRHHHLGVPDLGGAVRHDGRLFRRRLRGRCLSGRRVCSPCAWSWRRPACWSCRRPPMRCCNSSSRRSGDGFLGVLIASLALSLVPVAFLSACSPFVVRLLLVDLEAGGKTAGLVYSVSTLGNVAGTLATTFYLIPSFGTRAITTAFGVVLADRCGAPVPRTRAARQRRAHGGGSCGGACGRRARLAVGARAEEPARDAWAASYPEGPVWVGERLLYAEMAAHKVVEWRAGQRRDFWAEPGCGPTAISVYRDSELIVLCHIGGKLVHLDAAGRKIGRDRGGLERRAPAATPTTATPTARAACSSPTPASSCRARPPPARCSISPPTARCARSSTASTTPTASPWTSPSGGCSCRSIWRARSGSSTWATTSRITNRRLFLDVGKYFSEAEIDYAETGPDGIEVDRDGTVFVPDLRRRPHPGGGARRGGQQADRAP